MITHEIIFRSNFENLTHFYLWINAIIVVKDIDVTSTIKIQLPDEVFFVKYDEEAKKWAIQSDNSCPQNTHNIYPRLSEQVKDEILSEHYENNIDSEPIERK
ncbi:MAG TPA: hypothetical protein IAA29_00460 [Candidatus Paenibacillus intestinavium]|nr:hypothetical protein [Candidatus Paenibacillus intestinavium]